MYDSYYFIASEPLLSQASSNRKAVYLNYNIFLEQITKEVKELTNSQAMIRVDHVQKLNFPATDSMTILYPGENVAPAIYLDSFYQEFLAGTSMYAIAEEILAFCRKYRRQDKLDLSYYSDFRQVKDHIVCRLVNYEKNKTVLQKVPHQRFLDLAVVYYYLMENSLFGSAGILVQDTHLSMWEICHDNLHALAMENTRALLPPKMGTLSVLMEELKEPPLSPSDEDSSDVEASSMYILTNEDMCNGAVCICFNDILRSAGEAIGSDFYVLPSSIHECLLLPVQGWNANDPGRLQSIVSEINQEYVAPEEVLSDSVYRYRRDIELLSIAAIELKK